MRFHAGYLLICGLGLLSAQPALGQQPSPTVPAGRRTAELFEELRLLALLNPLELSDEQWSRLLPLAETARDGVTAIEGETKLALERQRSGLLAAREALLRGGELPATADSALTSQAQGVEALRVQKTEALLAGLAQRIHTLLTPEQEHRIETDLAPTGDQPWRLYARGAASTARALPNTLRLPSDPGTWVKELRDLRAQAARGEAPTAVQAFVRKLTRGLRAGTPLAEQSDTRARTLAGQVLSLSPAVFSRQEWTLAQAAARMEVESRNQQRVGDGKAAERFEAARWLAQQVLLSPRAADVIRERVPSNGTGRNG